MTADHDEFMIYRAVGDRTPGANAGTAIALVTLGTTVTGIPASAQANFIAAGEDGTGHRP